MFSILQIKIKQLFKIFINYNSINGKSGLEINDNELLNGDISHNKNVKSIKGNKGVKNITNNE